MGLILEPASQGQSSPPTGTAMLPEYIFIYRINFSTDLHLGPRPFSGESQVPPPLFHVAVGGVGRDSKSPVPQIQLHSGPDSTSPLLGSAAFDGLHASTISIYSRVSSSGSEVQVDLTQPSSRGPYTGAREEPHTFSCRGEDFQWVHCDEDSEVRALASSNFAGPQWSGNRYFYGGLKLVRTSDGRVLATFAGAKNSLKYNPLRILGLVKFAGVGSEEIKLLAMLSILTITEQGRRQANDEDTFNNESCCTVG